MRNNKLEGGLNCCLSRVTNRFTLLLLLSSLLAITMILYTPKQTTTALISPVQTGATTVSANSAHLLAYDNSTYGISIQYPSNWQKLQTEETKKENNDNDKPIVEFKLPSSIGANLVHKNDQATFIILIHKLPPQNMISKIISSFDSRRSQEISFEAFVLSHLTNLLTKLPDFHLIKSKSGETTLNDNTPAHKLVYTYSGGGKRVIMLLRTWKY